MPSFQPLHEPQKQVPPVTVLLVEDDVLQRSMMADFLRLEGIIVLESANVAEAKRLLSADRRIQLVLTDIQMPGEEDGIALAEYVQARYPRVGVLLVSGNPAAYDVGQRPFLPKPFDLQQLLSVARTLLCQRRSAGLGDE